MITVEQLLPSHNPPHSDEDGIEVPYDQISPNTLKNMIEEYVTREWSSLSDDDYTLETKVAQVLAQLRSRNIRVMFDFTSGTANLVSVG